jgi:hypothetical protein
MGVLARSASSRAENYFSRALSGRPKLAWRLAGPTLASMAEGTRLLEAQEPRDLGDRHRPVREIVPGQGCLELLHDLDEGRAFLCEPSRQRSLAHPKLFGDDIGSRRAMRQERCDGADPHLNKILVKVGEEALKARKRAVGINIGPVRMLVENGKSAAPDGNTISSTSLPKATSVPRTRAKAAALFSRRWTIETRVGANCLPVRRRYIRTAATMQNSI